MATQPNIIQLAEEQQSYAGQSLFQLAIKRLRRDRLTLIALAYIALVTLLAIFAPFISENLLQRDFGRTNITEAYIPPGGAERAFVSFEKTYRANNVYMLVTYPRRGATWDTIVETPLQTIRANADKGLLNIVHALQGFPTAQAPSVEILINGERSVLRAAEPAARASRLRFEQASDLLILPPGTADIVIRRVGAAEGEAPLLEVKAFPVAAGTLTTAILTGQPGREADTFTNLELLPVVTDLSNIPANKARLKYINASPNSPETYILVNDERKEASTTTYRGSNILDLEPGILTISTSAVGARTYTLGTDDLGRDQLARLLYGGQVSLGIGFFAAMISIIIGVSLGIITGFYGGIIDDLTNATITIIGSIPTLILLLIIVAVLNPGPEALILVLGLLGWLGTARLVRGETLSIRAREYIVSARSIGAPVSRIMFVHILPNLLSVVLITLALDIGGLILTESALSFLGFGIKDPFSSWGSMLANAQTFFTKGPHLVIWPGLLISLTVLSLYVIGDGLRDAFDPTLRN